MSSNQEQSTKRRKVQIGRITLSHLNSRNTQTPHVHTNTVFHTLDQFRSHPVGRTHHRSTLGDIFSELSTITKISELNITLEIDQHIVTLDVTVNTISLMDCQQRLEHLLANTGNLRFTNLTNRNHLSQ